MATIFRFEGMDAAWNAIPTVQETSESDFLLDSCLRLIPTPFRGRSFFCSICEVNLKQFRVPGVYLALANRGVLALFA
jgi:hypothetical protein